MFLTKTKAQTLLLLQQNSIELNILPCEVIKWCEYQNDKKTVLSRIVSFANNDELIIRSSSKSEDTDEVSNAGKYISVLHVQPGLEDIKKAIESVFDSYDHLEDDEEVLIQPMLKHVLKSGVAFTSDIDTMAEYYIINYDKGKDTAAVTGGSQSNTSTFIHYKNAPFEPEDSDMCAVINMCRKLEAFFDNSALDIEFAIDDVHKVWLFQVRPIVRKNVKKVNLDACLKRIYKKVKKLAAPRPFLLGDTT